MEGVAQHAALPSKYGITMNRFSFRYHPESNPGANRKSISHRCHPILVAFVLALTKATINLPLGRLQGGILEFLL